MTALRWFRLAGVILLYLALDAGAKLGARLAKRALKLDLRIDEWRHELQRREGVVTFVAGKIAGHVRDGVKSGQEEYGHLDERDTDLLARAIDNLGCHAQVWAQSLTWRRRDLYCTGSHVGLHALAPADRDAWADAIANLDGESDQ